MKVEVVVPALRYPGYLLASLEEQSRRPDLVTVVSNEVTTDTYAMPVQTIGFDSSVYCYGIGDAGLRRNIGAWLSDADIIIFQDDDQVAPRRMVEDCIAALEKEPVVWGHHRFVSSMSDWVRLLDAKAETGESRELGVNKEHAWLSCYAGMMAVHQSYFWSMDGFDMAYLGKHAGEDQDLGRRMMLEQGRTTVMIHEPPFAWHPKGKGAYLPAKTNACPEHVFEDRIIEGCVFRACGNCPYVVRTRDFDGAFPVIKFDPANVEVWL